MANLLDIASALLKNRDQAVSKTQDVAGAAPEMARRTALVTQIKGKYQPGETISKQDAETLKKLGTPVSREQQPRYADTELREKPTTQAALAKLGSIAGTALTGREISPEHVLKPVEMARKLTEGISRNAATNRKAIQQYADTEYRQDLERMGFLGKQLPTRATIPTAEQLFTQKPETARLAIMERANKAEDDVWKQRFENEQKGLLDYALEAVSRGQAKKEEKKWDDQTPYAKQQYREGIQNQQKEEWEKYKEEWTSAARVTGGVGAQALYPGSPFRQVTEGAEGEAEQMQKEALLDVPGSAIRGAVGAATIGAPEVFDLKEIARQDPMYEENAELASGIKAARAAAGVAGVLSGGAVTYGAIANKMSSMFGKLAALEGNAGRLGRVLTETPVLSTYVFKNASEEVVESIIRVGTGQEYTPMDFLAGVMMGAGFEGAGPLLSKIKKVEQKAKVENFLETSKEAAEGGALKTAEQGIKEAEVEKGAPLSETEVWNTVKPLPFMPNQTFGSMFTETRRAFKTGAPDGITGGKMTKLRPDEAKPSVTDVGVRIAAKPEAKIETKVEKAELMPWDEGYKPEAQRAEVAKVRKPVEITSDEAKQVIDELSIAEAGKRIKTDEGWTGQKSTFPKWIPEDLRTKSLVDGVLKNINEGTVPKGLKQKQLFDVVSNRMKGEEFTFRDTTLKEQTRTKIMEKIKAKDVRVSQVKQAIVDYAKKNLPLRERGKLLATVKNAKTWGNLEKAQEMMGRLGEKAEVRTVKESISKELKTVKVKRDKTGKPVGKYGAEAQDVLNQVREAVKIPKAQAQTKIAENAMPYIEKGEVMPLDVRLQNEILTKFSGLEEMDAKQLREVLETIKDTKGEGRMKQALKEFNRKTETMMWKETAEVVIRGGKEARPGVETMGIKGLEQEGIKGRLEEFKRTAGKEFMGWDDITDMISQLDKRSKVGESWLTKFSDVHDPARAEEGLKRKFTERTNNSYREIYGTKEGRQTLKQLSQDSKVERLGTFKNADGVEVQLDFSKAELRKRWMELQDKSLWRVEDGKNKGDLATNNKYTKEIVDAIDSKMTAKDKAFARDQMKMYNEMYDKMNPVYRDMYGTDIGKRDNYSPIRREGIDRDLSMGTNELLEAQTVKGSVQKGFMKGRVANPHPIAKQSDILAMMQQNQEAAHFVAWKEKVRDLEAVFGDGNVRNSIKQEYGTQTLKIIDDFIKDFTKGGSEQAKSIKLLDKVRSNYTQSVLALKPAIMIKQLTSFPAYMEKIKPREFFGGVADFLKGPKKIKEIVETLSESEMMKSRGSNIERDIKTMLNSDEFAAFKTNKSFKNMLMLPTKIGDKGAIYLGGWSHYKAKKAQFLKEGMSDAEAHKLALRDFEKATLKAQQSSDIADLSYLQRGNPMMKLLTMFKSSPNLYFRKELNAIRGALTGRMSKKQAAKTLAIYHFLLPNIYQAVSNAGAGEVDWKEQARASLLGSFNGVFILGEMMDSMIASAIGAKQFSGGAESPVFDTLGEITDMPKRVYDILINDEISPDDWWKAVEKLADTTGDVTGLPLKTLKRATHDGIYENIIRDQDYAAGIMTTLGWSPYYTEKLKKKSPVEKAMMEEAELVKEEKAAVKDTATQAYKEVKKLKAEGKTSEAKEIVEGLSEAEYKEFEKMAEKQRKEDLPEEDQIILDIKKKPIRVRGAGYSARIKELRDQGDRDAAQAVVDNMTDKEYDAFISYQQSLK